MKLLLDQNLSHRLLPALETTFPGSTQVRLLGMDADDDLTIWAYAKAEGFAIVTKDSDFVELSAVHGMPPKIIWLNLGNVSNAVVRNRLMEHLIAIRLFLESHEVGVFEIE